MNEGGERVDGLVSLDKALYQRKDDSDKRRVNYVEFMKGSLQPNARDTFSFGDRSQPAGARLRCFRHDLLCQSDWQGQQLGHQHEQAVEDH